MAPASSPAASSSAAADLAVEASDATTPVGLRVDAHARVLGTIDRPIPGLQAIGLDINSRWRCRAPGDGANNTLGLTFGFIAAMALARQTDFTSPLEPR